MFAVSAPQPPRPPVTLLRASLDALCDRVERYARCLSEPGAGCPPADYTADLLAELAAALAVKTGARS
jgi:hypothetical protein